MTFAVSGALQAGVYAELAGDAPLQALVSGAVFDAVPSGVLPPVYVLVGEETVRDASDMLAGGAVHDFVVTISADTGGFATAKAAAAAVCDALIDAQPVLARGRVVALNFRSAKSFRDGNGRRQVDLRFRARTDDV